MHDHASLSHTLVGVQEAKLTICLNIFSTRWINALASWNSVVISLDSSRRDSYSFFQISSYSVTLKLGRLERAN
jgi:hypothetical protein